METVNPVWDAQLLCQLRITGKWLGFLINNNVPLIKNGIRRIVLNLSYCNCALLARIPPKKLICRLFFLLSGFNNAIGRFTFRNTFLRTCHILFLIIEKAPVEDEDGDNTN